MNKNTAGKPKKVSLMKCLHILDRIEMPWTMLFIALVFTVFSAWMSMTTVTFSGSAVDASGNIPTAELIKYLGATALSLVFLVASGVFSNQAYVKMQHLMRNQLWHKIIVTRQKCFDKDGGEGMVSRITQDCDYLGKFFEMTFGLFTTITTFVMYLLQMWLINRKITSWTLLCIPICLVFGTIYTVLRFLVAVNVQQRLADSTAYLAERTKDLNLIKTCNAQKTELEKGRAYFAQQAKAQMKVGYVEMFQSVIGTMLDVVAKVVPFAVGAVLVANGEMTVGSLVVINTLFGSITGAFGTVLTNLGTIKEANGALARVADFFDEEEEDVEAGRALSPAQVGDIRLADARFAYNADKVILKGVSCHIPENKVTAIIGTNGSGKSTMFKLITRLYELDGGSLTIGGEDAAQYSLRSWRERICLIAQGSPMMEGTLRENICYGRTDAVSDEELEQVARLSHVWDFLKDLPNGFDSPVAPGGSNFSGGQKQCVAIARALMSRSEFVLLDESTSNLDARREKDVLDAVSAAMKGRTIVIIAHSLAAIKNADHVIVLSGGQIEAEGSPQEIVARTDNYLNKMMNRRHISGPVQA